MKTFEVYLQGKLIGTALLESEDFPWCHGVFDASSNFAEVEELFIRELSLLAEDEEAWELIWQDIESKGLEIKDTVNGETTSNPLLHIDGQKIWWRA